MRAFLRNIMNTMKAWPWHQVFAAWALIVILMVYTCFHFMSSGTGLIVVLAVSLWSAWPMFLWSMLLLTPWSKKVAMTGLILIPVMLLCAWQIASIELYLEQKRLLSWKELCFLFINPGGRAIIWSYLWSFSVIFYVTVFFTLYGGMLVAWRRLHIDRFFIVPVSVLIVVFGIGGLAGSCFIADPIITRQIRLCSMPWSQMSDSYRDDPIAVESLAQTMWYTAVPDMFEETQDPLISARRMQYPQRSLVIILLESHALLHTEKVGGGVQSAQNCSPVLSHYMKNNLSFTNYFQSAFSTQAAAWCLLNGFPFHYETEFTPRLSRFGPAKDFVLAGYQLEWLQGTNAGFAGFQKMADEIGMNCGPSIDEQRRMRDVDSDLWTAWGMPDEQLFAIAAERLQRYETPYVQFILTVSNHHPFNLPATIDGHAISKDHLGGMRYADACLGNFLKQIERISEPERPIVFITADTAFRGSTPEYQPAHNGIPAEPLESMRIPGVLIVPTSDFRRAEQCDAMFCHEDVLPFLASMVGVPTRFDQRFSQYKRSALVVDNEEGRIVLSPNNYLFAGQTFMEISTRWSLTSLSPDGHHFERLKRIHDYFDEMRSSLWIYGDQ